MGQIRRVARKFRSEPRSGSLVATHSVQACSLRSCDGEIDAPEMESGWKAAVYF